MNDEAPRETAAGWIILAIGSVLTICAPVALIVLASYIQLNPFISGYDVGLQDPPPPLNLFQILVGMAKFALYCLMTAIAVAITSTRVRMGSTLAYVAAPLLFAAFISVWMRLSLLWSLTALVGVFGVVGWLWLAAYLFNRLLSPKKREYEPVVLADAGWSDAAGEPELD